MSSSRWRRRANTCSAAARAHPRATGRPSTSCRAEPGRTPRRKRRAAALAARGGRLARIVEVVARGGRSGPRRRSTSSCRSAERERRGISVRNARRARQSVTVRSTVRSTASTVRGMLTTMPSAPFGCTLECDIGILSHDSRCAEEQAGKEQDFRFHRHLHVDPKTNVTFFAGPQNFR